MRNSRILNRGPELDDWENVRFVTNLVVTLFVMPMFGLLWYMLRRAMDQGSRNKDDLAKHKLHAAETFATKTSVDAAALRIEQSVERAFERFDRKLDGIDLKLDRKADRGER